MNINAQFKSSGGIRPLQLQVLSYLQQHWKWFAAEGLFLITMGTTAIIVPSVFTLGITLFLGWLLLVCGVFQTVRVISISNMPGFGLWLFSGVLQIIIGYFLVADPTEGRMTLTLLLSIFFAMDGLAKVSLAVMLRPLARWGWTIFSGLTSLFLAIIVWAGWPGTAVWIPGLLLGINLIFAGWSLLYISLHHKSQ
ncbi:HdeD family acid-resistance protein [Methylomonas paludis]|uniref:HdeD family acid-resistance protein n=1 Tax=Methylomonas paludis TaxID=1173101 RepID=A0A975MLV2_9GAMM|nr:HdeD family acid-resistance protein [Methylomonas paludis]QWF69759.1 HdeD family acid-resistance protein [Methylomonas paludis]